MNLNSGVHSFYRVSKEDMQLALTEAVQSIVDDFLQAEKNELLPRPE